MTVHIKRVYEQPDDADGYRVLVDRVWPRGVSKEHAHVDEWCKDAGPSTDLRKWFGHVPERFPEFVRRYRAEIAANEVTEHLREVVRAHRVVTLVYSAKDTEHNQAVVLRDVLTGKRTLEP